MTLYHVHIYREMRLYFPGIEADTPQAAAELAAARPTPDAEYTEDCDGATLSALVDVADDDEFARSVTIDFEPEQSRKAAPALREALAWLATAAEDLDAAIDGATSEFDIERLELKTACQNARDVFASRDRLDVHELLAARKQVAVIWGIDDVRSVRPDLTDDQAWEVLTECRRKHDCEWGFTWTYIKDMADILFPEQPSTTKE